jgi:peptidoglycan L-alanyl-D-glutamate endopeptidase CwlK
VIQSLLIIYYIKNNYIECEKGEKQKMTNDYNKLIKPLNEKLVKLYEEVFLITPVYFKITEGIRTPQRQQLLLNEGKTKILQSKHLTGDAIDICPLINNKLDYEARDDIMFLQGLFYGVASQMGIKIRVGSLWDGKSIKENGFVDGWHIELV